MKKAKIQLLASLREMGKTQQKFADEIGVCKSTLRSYIDKNITPNLRVAYLIESATKNTSYPVKATDWLADDMEEKKKNCKNGKDENID